MAKRVFIIHGWGGYPEEGWFPWFKKELENKNFKCEVPAMPDTSNPKINIWVSFLSENVGEPDENVYFVGHSIGSQTIMRYLEKLPKNIKIGGAIFVAGWFNLTDDTWDENYTKEIADEWLNKAIDFNSVKQHTSNFVLINSDNDPFVPLSDTELFKNNLGAKIIVEKSRGHISGEDGVKELPIVLEELLNMARI